MLNGGVGISREHQERSFETFHRLNPLLEEEGQASLARSEELERQNGRIWAELELKKSGTFLFASPQKRRSLCNGSTVFPPPITPE
jgi:light-regulated signal transduction histidine kinase (bacteriophytochrome)